MFQVCMWMATIRKELNVLPINVNWFRIANYQMVTVTAVVVPINVRTLKHGSLKSSILPAIIFVEADFVKNNKNHKTIYSVTQSKRMVCSLCKRYQCVMKGGNPLKSCMLVQMLIHLDDNKYQKITTARRMN